MLRNVNFYIFLVSMCIYNKNWLSGRLITVEVLQENCVLSQLVLGIQTLVWCLRTPVGRPRSITWNTPFANYVSCKFSGVAKINQYHI